METKHTEGEWTMSKQDSNMYSVHAPGRLNGTPVAMINPFNKDVHPEAVEANAKLMTAAPELLEQLSEITELVEGLKELGAFNGMSAKHAISEINFRSKKAIRRATE